MGFRSSQTIPDSGYPVPWNRREPSDSSVLPTVLCPFCILQWQFASVLMFFSRIIIIKIRDGLEHDLVVAPSLQIPNFLRSIRLVIDHHIRARFGKLCPSTSIKPTFAVLIAAFQFPYLFQLFPVFSVDEIFADVSEWFSPFRKGCASDLSIFLPFWVRTLAEDTTSPIAHVLSRSSALYPREILIVPGILSQLRNCLFLRLVAFERRQAFCLSGGKE